MVIPLSAQAPASAAQLLRALLPLSQRYCGWNHYSTAPSDRRTSGPHPRNTSRGPGPPPHSGGSSAHNTEQHTSSQPPAFPPGDQQQLLRVALVGYPNAGKSQLTNRLVGSKVTSVSPKRNTTIKPHLGAFSEGTRQVVLYDTPGLVQQLEQKHQPERVRSAWQTATECDALLFIVDANAMFQYKHSAGLQLARQLKDGPPIYALEAPWRCPHAVLVLNKQDKLPRDLRIQVMRRMEDLLMRDTVFQRCFWTSALLGQGIGQVREYLLEQTRPGAWLLPAGMAHYQDAGDMAAEMVREKLFHHLHQELPYALAPQLQGEPHVMADGRLRVVVGIAVRNEVQRAIVVGRQGAVVQGLVAGPVEAELASRLGRPVSLMVRVQVQQEGK